MVKLLVLVLIGYVIYQMFKGRSDVAKANSNSEQEEETFRDPVCGTYVARGDAVVGTLEGQKLYFCSMSCLEKFRNQVENTEKNSIGGEK